MVIKRSSVVDYQRIRGIVESVVEEVVEEKIKHLPTREEFNQKVVLIEKIYIQNDKIIKKLESKEQEDLLKAHQESDREERITALEDIYPQGRHTVK